MPPRKPKNPGRLRVHCGSPDCHRLYMQLVYIDLKVAARPQNVEIVTALLARDRAAW
jgi:hypothetical protein